MAARQISVRSLINTSLFAASGYAASQCYYPNGTVNVDSQPCNLSAENSACCGPTDACLSNGYCLQQSGNWGNRIARGACTAKGWDDAACPQYCADDSTYPSQALLLVADTLSGSFCCSAGLGSVAYNTTTNECLVSTQGNTQPFTLPFGEVIYDRSTGATLSGTLNASSISASSTATQTQTVTAAASNTDQDSSTTAIAAGIAVPLAVLLIAALVSTAILWTKLRKAEKQLQDQSAASAFSYDSSTPAQSLLPAYPYQSPIHEVGHTERNELPAQDVIKEAP